MKRTINILLLTSFITTSVVNADWQDDMLSYYASARNSALAVLKTLDEAGIINEADTTKALKNLNVEQDLDGTLATFINENVKEVSNPAQELIIETTSTTAVITTTTPAFNDAPAVKTTISIPKLEFVQPAEKIKNWVGDNWNAATRSIKSWTNSAVDGTKESITSVATLAKENPLRAGVLGAGALGVIAGGVVAYKYRNQINAKCPSLFKFAGVTALATAAVVALQCKTGMFDKIIETLPISAAFATATTATAAGATTGLAALAMSNVLNVPDYEIVAKSKELVDNLNYAQLILIQDPQNTPLTLSLSTADYHAIMLKNEAKTAEIAGLVWESGHQSIISTFENFKQAYNAYELILAKAVASESTEIIAIKTARKVLDEQLASLRSVVNAVKA